MEFSHIHATLLCTQCFYTSIPVAGSACYYVLMHLYTHTYTHILSQGRGGAKAVLQPLVQIYGCSTYLPSKQKIINDKLSIAASVNLNLMTLWQRL